MAHLPATLVPFEEGDKIRVFIASITEKKVMLEDKAKEVFVMAREDFKDTELVLTGNIVVLEKVEDGFNVVSVEKMKPLRKNSRSGSLGAEFRHLN